MSEPDPSRPGSVLRAEREALGVTVREVAETLNLSPTVIEAIEADDHGRLPGPVFARGYVRAYARLLELDPAPLLAHYPKPDEFRPPTSTSTESEVWEWVRGRPGIVLGAAGVLLLALLVLLLTWIWPDPEDDPATPEQPAEAAPGELPPPRPLSSGEAADTAPAPADPPGTEPAATAGPAAGEDEAEVSDEGAGGVVDPAAAARTVLPGAVNATAADDPQATAPGEAVRRITATGDDRLTFRFSDDCWVEVRDAAGSSLYSNLSRGDTRLVLIGQGPFRILLGYAPGVRLDFNGEDVALAPHTRDNVATLVLGQ